MLTPFGRPIGMRLRQMQTPHVRLQLQPCRFPVLRRRFHDHLLHAALPQPLHQMLPFLGGGPKARALQQPFPFHCHVRGHDHDHLLVYVDSCYGVGH
jgi:hypothetical protein